MATNRWLSLLTDAARAIARELTRSPQRGTDDRARTAPAPVRRGEPAPSGTPKPGPRPGAATSSPTPPTTRTATPGAYPGDFTGTVRAEYAPHLDGDADPGEIVWTWVPYEEDHTQGKDRPVLLVGRDGSWLLGVMLTSKDRSRQAAEEARWGRFWLDIGTGPWDRQGRESEVRLDRVVRVDPTGVRREGAVVERRLFDQVVQGIQAARRA